MSLARIQTGGKEPIEVVAVGAGSPAPLLIGLTDLEIKIRRNSDGFYFDWSDDNFKAFGSVVTLLQPLVQVDPTASPGEYKLNIAVRHVNGFDTSTIVNPSATPAAEEIYRITAIQTTLTNAINFPQFGELTEGGFVDLLDAAITSRAAPGAAMALTTAERAAVADSVLTELVSDHETALNGTESLADTIALIRKILNNKLDLVDGGTTSNWVLKDDDDSTTLRTYDVSDKDGNALSLPVGLPARRTRGV